MGTPASASGSAREAMMPGKARSNGPSHLKIRQPGSEAIPDGTFSSRHTTDSSSGVRAIETKSPLEDHCGTSAFASSRETAYRPGNRVSVSNALGVIAIDPFLGLRWLVTRQEIQ